MTRPTHDAELCDRIRALEEQVAELKGELELHRNGGAHWTGPTWVYPYAPWPNTTYPWSPNTSVPTITYGTVITSWSTTPDPDTQYTLT